MVLGQNLCTFTNSKKSRARQKMTKDIFHEQLPYAAGGPFSYEIISSRRSGKYRIHDSRDNAMGSADTQEEAEAIVRQLNAR